MTSEPLRRSSGTLHKRRKQLSWPADEPFKILSIDGGGIAGILPAAYLAELEVRFLSGESIASRFDMISGTSTGGIIALGLANGLTAGEILRFYLDRGNRIFPTTHTLGRLMRNLIRVQRSVYDANVLHSELVQVFGDAVLGSVQKRLVIPSYEGRFGEPWLFKTPHHPDFAQDRHERITSVARATTAAPTYLPVFAHNHYMFVDGGIWANNPIMNAVVDALSCFNVERQQVQVLSLGCGETVHQVHKGISNAGLWGWRTAIQAAIRAQSKNALGQTFLLLGKNNVVRVDAPERRDRVPLDDYQRASCELPPIARAMAEANGNAIHQQFLSKQVSKYSPILDGNV